MKYFEVFHIANNNLKSVIIKKELRNVMKKIILGILLFILVFIALMISGCSSQSEQYEKAMTLYEKTKFAEAAKAFGKIKNYEDAEKMQEKCILLTSWQNTESAEKTLSEWKDYAGNDNRTFWSSNSVTQENTPTFHTNDSSSLNDPDSFFKWVLSYGEKKGAREILAAVYPYLHEVCDKNTKFILLSSLPDSLDDYIEEFAAMHDLYSKNQTLVEMAEKYNGIRINSKTSELGFCSWIKENEGNELLLSQLENFIEKPANLDLDMMEWNRVRLEEYFGKKDYHPSDPQDLTLLMVSEDNSEKTNLNKEKSAIEKAVPDFAFENDPDRASVYIYYLLTRQSQQYISDNSFLTVKEGTVNYKAVDAVTNKTIAEYSCSRNAPDSLKSLGNNSPVYDPEEEDDKDFLLFLKKIKTYEKSKK